MRRLILLGLLAGCASGREQGVPRPAPDAAPAEVFFTSPPWAYRLGPELYAEAVSDSALVREQLLRKGTAMGCHAVVAITIPQNAGGKVRPWGFCAWRAEPVKASR